MLRCRGLKRPNCWSGWQNQVYHRKRQPHSHHSGRYVRGLYIFNRIQNPDKFSSQQNPHPGFFPKYQNCPRRHRLVDPRLTTRKGIRGPAHCRQSYETESALGDVLRLYFTCTVHCKPFHDAADQNQNYNNIKCDTDTGG